MPPSPTIKASLDPHKYVALCEAMGIEYPPAAGFVTRGRQGGRRRVHGSYSSTTNTITIYLNMPEQDAEALRFLASELTITLLHELRHRWQDEQHGVDWYASHVVAAERDAEDYAHLHCQEWR